MNATEDMEYEYKSLICKEEYSHLLKHFQKTEKDCFKQVNHYFDTANFLLKEKNAALRIREFESSGECTLKIKKGLGHLEINEKINKEEIPLLLTLFQLDDDSQIKKQLEKFGIQQEDIAYWGTLTTYRCEFKIPQGLLAIDKNCFLDFIDYELELEVSEYEANRCKFQDFLSELNLPFRPSKNKVARLYEKLFSL